MPNHSLIPERPEYYVQTGSMFENPYGVPHDEIVSMILEQPAETAAQVIFGKYVESSGLVFTGETIQMMLDRQGEHYPTDVPTTPEGRIPQWRITADRWFSKTALAEARNMSPARRKLSFASGVDFARQTDYTVLTTLDVRTLPARVVAWRRLNRVPWEAIYREVGRVAWAFGSTVLGDSSGMGGDVIFDNLEDRLYCPVHDRIISRDSGICRDRNGNPLGGCPLPMDDDRTNEPRIISLAAVDGFDFTTKSKKNLIEHLRNSLQFGYRAGSEEPFGLIRTPPIVKVEEELSFYAWDDKGLETDCVMSLALAAWAGLEDMPREAVVGSIYGQ